MKMQIATALIGTACALTVPAVNAVTCRSATAATQGSQNGYAFDVAAADQVQQNNKTASDALGQCVAAVVNLPTLSSFPSLSQIFDAARNQICTAISSEVNSVIRTAMPTIPTFPTLPSIPATSTAQNATRASALSVTAATYAATSSTPTDASTTDATVTDTAADFWQHIWR